VFSVPCDGSSEPGRAGVDVEVGACAVPDAGPRDAGPAGEHERVAAPRVPRSVTRDPHRASRAHPRS
jgi:hypothetical protein